MREIKFRQYVWDDSSKKEGQMVGWDTLLAEECEGLSAVFSTTFSNASPLMQYTGLKDKNGKEIYEGDILQDTEDIAKVAFDMGQYMAFYRTSKGEWKPYGTLLKYMLDHDGEIIGDIYKNPEMLTD